MFLDSAPWELSTFQCFVRVWYLRGAGGRCLAASLLITVFRRSLSSTIGICLGLACHTRTMLCRVCLSSSRHFPMLCLSSLLRLQYMLCSSFCLCIAGILLRVSSCGQSAKALFFSRSLSPTCWSETSCLSSISKSTDVFFFFFFLPHPPQQCLCVCLVGSCQDTFAQGFEIPLPAPLIGQTVIFSRCCVGAFSFLKTFPWSEQCESVWVRGNGSSKLIQCYSFRFIIHYQKSQKGCSIVYTQLYIA